MLLVLLDGSTFIKSGPLPAALELVQAFKAQLVGVASTEPKLAIMFTEEDRNVILEQNSHVKVEEHLLHDRRK